MPPSTAKPKSGTQQTLLGFFAKAPSSNETRSNPPPTTSNKVKSSQREPSSASPLDFDEDSSLTPPPTVRKPKSSTSSNNQLQHQRSSSSLTSSSRSPTETRTLQKVNQVEARNIRHSNELTPPSSSPVMDLDEDEQENEITRFPRRRAAAKRRIKYVESDEEGMSQNGGDDDDDDDRFSPEKEDARSLKKSRGTNNRTLSDDDDDEFGDFIVPDEEFLGALESAESSPVLQKKKQKTQERVNLPSSTASRPTASSSAWSSSSKPFPGTLAAGKAANSSSNGKKGNNDEMPYDFLLNPLDENRHPPNHPDFDPRTLFIPEKTMKTLTPFEKQYWDIKRKHNDTVLFFQKGKFYELYEDDALIAHREFGLKVTDRVKMKMAGVPESSYTMFANKFLALGYKVGRVDQTETAVGKDMRKSAAGTKSKASSVANSDDSGSKIVRRDLRSIMTTGTIIDADCLPDDMSSYCISIKEVVDDQSASDGRGAAGLTGGDDDESMQAKITFGICILDAGVAQFNLHYFVDDVTRTKLETLLQSLRIKEVIYEKGHLSKRTLRIVRNTVEAACNITMLKSGVEFLNEEMTLRKLNLILNKDLADADPDDLESISPIEPELLPLAIAESLDKPEAMSALGAMLNYLTQLNLDKDICASLNFDIFDPLSRNECMILDAQSLTHLNVLVNEQGDGQGTLLQLINRAVTPFGKRLMKVWLLSPLAKIESIQLRQDAVEEFIKDTNLPDEFDAFAKSLPDIERIMPRIYAGNCKSKDFARVLRSLIRVDGQVETWKQLASQYETEVVGQLLNSIPSISPQAKNIYDKYEDESFEPRGGSDEGYDEADEAIRSVEKALNDELKKAAALVKLPREKVKFKDVGTNEIYQIEVPIKTSVPLDWALTSQTQSVKRYYSQPVRVLVKQLKEARETRLAALKTFQAKLFKEFQLEGEVFLQAVKGLAELDCLVSLAKASIAMNEPTCRAEFVDSETALIDFIDLRHPCLANASTSEFISNDIQLGGEDEEKPTVTILTGGNMAGKSTTARTTATGVILAQLGCRVPAIGARLSPIDRIATRMGANDQLFRNNSTFMVEMLEASRILKDGSPRSLVIMDELGRGTSTFDGQAIAYSVLHYLIGQSRCLCFFLTHYTQLAYDFEGHLGVKNKHMQVLVDNENKEVVFTYKLVEGIAESSYGTEVAALAGIPDEICERAQSISKSFLESTREMEAQRKHNVGSKLETSTISDFVHLFRAGLAAEASPTEGEGAIVKDGEVLSGKAIAFMRKQMEYLVAKLDGKNAAIGTINSRKELPARPTTVQYSRRTKRPRLGSEGDDMPTMSEDERHTTTAESRQKLPSSFKSSGSGKAEQMVLDLGQRIQITCKECGMTFDRSDLDDSTTHDKYHSRLVKGIEWTGKHLLARRQCTTGGGELGASNAIYLRKLGSEVKMMTYDWSQIGFDATIMMKLDEVQKVMEEAIGANPFPLHLRRQTKITLAVLGGRVIGTLIAGVTPKGKARRVMDGSKNAGGSREEAVFVPKEDYLSDESTPPLAIYRIHVLSLARRSGLASAMLDAALQDCVYGMSSKALIEMYKGKANTTAFSQPTQAGKMLAEKWIRRDGGEYNGNEAGQLIVFDEA